MIKQQQRRRLLGISIVNPGSILTNENNERKQFHIKLLGIVFQKGSLKCHPSSVFGNLAMLFILLYMTLRILVIYTSTGPHPYHSS